MKSVSVWGRVCASAACCGVMTGPVAVAEPYQLENPMSPTYLQEHLRSELPRLVLSPANERNLREQLRTNPLIQNLYAVIERDAAAVMKQSIISLDRPENPNEQRNQLSVSRDFLHRINVLAMVYRLGEDPAVLQRINQEVVAACRFPSWNPAHFLDVGEMALAVALAIDWTAGALPESTQNLAKRALVEKGILPSWPEDGSTLRWVHASNNWNQVCHGGMIAASVVVAESEPELAAKTIHRALDGMNHALNVYAPDGVYPEGAIYWGYGTLFSVTTAEMLESAFGTDFGVADFPGFMESATFRKMVSAPSERLFNFADCSEWPERYTDFALSWFATKTGNQAFLNETQFRTPPERAARLSRLAGAGLVWTARFESKKAGRLPTAWKGEGMNPLVVFTGEDGDGTHYYFGGKGGRGSLHHGNLDAGSFIFELGGVRWGVDPGNQSYGALERAGFDLWGREQDSARWTLLTKNNFGHSTLTVNDELHRADGTAYIIAFQGGPRPEATFDLTPVFEGFLSSARRTFTKDSPVSLLVEDHVQCLEAMHTITWQFITTAEVERVDGGAVLRQDGKTLRIDNLSHPHLPVSVVHLDPPPSRFDKRIERLKRLEICVAREGTEAQEIRLKVRLSGVGTP